MKTAILLLASSCFLASLIACIDLEPYPLVEVPEAAPCDAADADADADADACGEDPAEAGP